MPEEQDEEMPIPEESAPVMVSLVRESAMQLSADDRSPPVQKQPESLETSFRPMYRRYREAAPRSLPMAPPNVQQKSSTMSPPKIQSRPITIKESPEPHHSISALNFSADLSAASKAAPIVQSPVTLEAQLPTQWAFKTRPLIVPSAVQKGEEEPPVKIERATKLPLPPKQPALEDKLDALLQKVCALNEKVNQPTVPQPPPKQEQPESMSEQYKSIQHSPGFHATPSQEAQLLKEQNALLKAQLEFAQRQCEMLMEFNKRQDAVVAPIALIGQRPAMPATPATQQSIAEWAQVSQRIQQRPLGPESPAPRKTCLKDPYAGGAGPQRRALYIEEPNAPLRLEPGTPLAVAPRQELGDPYKPPEKVPTVARKQTAKRQTGTKQAQPVQAQQKQAPQPAPPKLSVEPFVFDREINALEQEMNQLAMRAQSLF